MGCDTIVKCFCTILLVVCMKFEMLPAESDRMLTYMDNRPGSVFQQIVVDESSGNVFIGGRNHLYRLNHDLELIQDIRTGPSIDATWCPGINCNDTEMDNDASVLEMYPNQEFLLYCGTVRHGLCTVYSPKNIEVMHSMNPDNKLNLLGSRTGTVVFFGESGTHGTSVTALYAGVSYDDRPLEFASKAVSSRVFNHDKTSNTYNMSYTYTANNISSSIDIVTPLKEDYKVSYIYGFQHKDFSYFVTVQRESITGSRYQTRIIRVCKKDVAFYSYSEIEVTCRKADYHTVHFNIATAAYFGSVGEDVSTRYHIHEGEKMLYVAFGKSRTGSSVPEAEYGSGVCMFSLRTLQKAFVESQKQCYRGYGNLIQWIVPMGPRCTASSDPTELLKIDEGFCGSPINVGVGSRYPLKAVANVSSDHHVATAIGVVIYQNKTIAILGTQAGEIIKVLIDGTNSPPYAVIDVGGGQEHPEVKRDIAFDEDQQHIYAMTGNKVSKVAVQSCRVYNQCSDCVTTKDPLDCGWCGNYCATKSECVSHPWLKESCTPIIYSFTPTSGPLQGGTNVTIHGRNFGANTSIEGVSTFVKVAFVECPLVYKNTTVIMCKTNEVEREIIREVSVTVVDRTKSTVDHDIEGTTTSGHDSFFYKNCSVSSFTPSMGPKSGGTRVTIYGTNLDIGSNTRVYVTHMPCIPDIIQPSKIVCITTQFQPEFDYKFGNSSGSSGHLQKRSLNSGHVAVAIDSGEMLVPGEFSYEDDPTIEYVTPRESIMSGGIKITVTGYNLHVIQEPMIGAMVQGEKDVIYMGLCQASTTGQSMTCFSPNVSASNWDYDEENPGKASIFFIMDGVNDLRDFSVTHPNLSGFTYVADPVIYPFSGDDKTRTFFMYESHLNILGDHLNLMRLERDVNVTVGTDVCNVTQLSRTVLLCEPLRPKVIGEQEPLRVVRVKIGNLNFPVGSLQYSKKEKVDLWTVVIAVIMVVVCVTITVGMLAWMKKTQRGPFKIKMNPNEPSFRYTRGNIVEIGGSGREQVYQLHNNENRYMAHGQARYRGSVATPGLDMVVDDESRRLIDDAHLLIDRQNLLLLEVIGQGHFGCVYRGCMKQEGSKEEVEVAVKTLKSLTESNYSSASDGKKFLEEALRMREFDHPRILKLIGIAMDKEELPLVVLPFMSHGDLLSYIRDETNSPTVKELMDYGTQVAEGMAYLSSLKFVHRDLAARNCMLDDSMNVKVADFGLSRDIYERDYYSSDDRKAKLPVKWMALESLEKGIYNIKTDVWSYGVVLWELMTRGVCPYPEVDNWDIIKYLKQGRRMPQPSYCPDGLYDIMLLCWQEDPRVRPPFDDLVYGVKSVIAGMEKTHQRVGHNVTYMNVPTTQTYLYPQNSRSTSPEEMGSQVIPDDHMLSHAQSPPPPQVMPVLTIAQDSSPTAAGAVGGPMPRPEGQAMSTLV